MAYSLIDNVFGQSSGGAGNGFTTGAIDTTGAKLLVVVAASHTSGPDVSITDSKSNTYTGLTIYSDAGTGTQIQIFWVNNASPTVGSGHTFTVTGNASYPAIDCLAFSNSAGSAFDKESGATGNVVDTLQPGSVTPAANDAVLVLGVCSNSVSGTSCNSSFIETSDQAYPVGVAMGLAVYYKIQTTATAENPTLTFGGSFPVCAAAIAVFNLAAGPAGHPAMRHTALTGFNRPVEVGRTGSVVIRERPQLWLPKKQLLIAC